MATEKAETDRIPVTLALATIGYLEKLVKEGKLGFKSGEGFRKWMPEQQSQLRSKVLQHLKNSRAEDTNSSS